METSGLALENVVLSVHGKAVLNNVSFHADEKRIGLIGANGSGKSTLARVILGLLQINSGELRVHGVDIWKDRKAALKTVGMLFQNPDHQIIFPTCEEEIAFGLTQLGQSKEKARRAALEILARFGRADWASRSTHDLSQGQRHFLCLLSVLVMQPKLLVFDEPYAGLDLPTSIQLHRSIDALEQQVVLITHDMDVLADFDRVIWLDHGEIAGDGKPSDIIPKYIAEMTTRAGETDA
ncbi:cobalt ABC transporter [Amylibacter kogurei]|uniref:Cobalt ABC transporter n=1 Tax=Paramylibacter kogurei TaxID=1889778 RepID=A0A2G5KAW0_9RHOB|nr:ABC transporter ATP-binding protein [Amylibacter kogurei]PIB26173.1 cobalt ABC transporter [Amylibacter kogurei]